MAHHLVRRTMTIRLLFRCALRFSACLWPLGMCSPAAATVSVGKTADLLYGAFFAGSTSGTVVIAPGGGRSKTGGVLLFDHSSAGVPAASAAAFSVSGGPPNGVCTITLPAESTITSAGGGSLVVSMPVSSTGPGPTPSVMLNAAGAAIFTVGATLSVPAIQSGGHYGTGYFNVAVTCPNP